jgi:hypothetical protein
VRMLDLEFCKGKRFECQRKLDYRVVPKATSVAVPLLPTSGQHSSTHWAWPHGQLLRCEKLCSSRLLADEAKAHFFQAWTQHGVLTSSRKPRVAKPSERTCRLVMPAHPMLQRGQWNRHLASMTVRWKSVSASPLQFGMSWSLAGVHTVRALRQLHGQYHGSMPEPVIFESQTVG